MSVSIHSFTRELKPRSAGRFWLERFRRGFLDALSGLRHGAVQVREDGAEPLVLGEAGGPILQANVHSPDFYRYAVLGGTVGLGEAYALGLWSAPDLVGLVRLMLRNIDHLDRLDSGLARLRLPLLKLFDWRHRNDPRRSRLNIAAHYDLGNAFFRTFLDRSLTYSSAMFRTGAETLEEAQREKLDTVCRKLELKPGDRVIEIGSGWGSFALHAAGRYGAQVTTTTLSREQHRLACERVQAAGLADRVQVLLRDYRALEGRYDKLVSIEMIEAVGHEHHPDYFRVCERLLKPDGQALIQAIVCPDQRYDLYRRSSDFIRRYIFPGGHLPSLTRLLEVATAHTRLRLFHLEDFSRDYAATLAAWRKRFWERQAEIRALGYGEVFQRLWDFYLAICEAGFAEHFNAVVQLLFVAPECRRAPVRA